MQQRRTSDFKRGIKALATQHGWFVEIGDRKGPTERMVIYQREGGQSIRIATIVLRADQKDVKPIVARTLLRKLQERLVREVADAAAEESVHQSIEILIEWVKTWF